LGNANAETWYSDSDGVVGPRTMRQLDIALGRPTLDFKTFEQGLSNGAYAYRAPSRGFVIEDEPAWIRGRGGRMKRNPDYERPQKQKKLPELSGSFHERVEQIAGELAVPAKWLMAIMSFETGGSFSSSQKNGAGSGATGLIQFMPNTAKELGTTTAALSRMTPENQLEYVREYFHMQKKYTGLSQIGSLEDMYMMVLYPAAAGKGPDHVLFSAGSREYTQNRGLDISKNGNVTVREAGAKVREHLARVENDYGDKFKA